MPYQGIDLTAEAGQASTTISWHLPHAFFVIILVGPQEIPFGIQKDLLLAQSPYYREYFAHRAEGDGIEEIVHLPDTTADVFGCFQNFIFTGKVYDKDGGKEVPGYALLLGVWKLAVKLKMAPLRVAVMDAMSERRIQTSTIPEPALLIQSWKETEIGSGLRLMLISWAAEHMRSVPQSRVKFARALPQEILSELVIAMSDLPLENAAPRPIQHASIKRLRPVDDVPPRQESTPAPAKRSRQSTIPVVNRDDEDAKSKIIAVKKAPRKSAGRRSTRFGTSEADSGRDMVFCADLINKMLSAPGFWTRLVAPFRNPVDPVADKVPNYFAVVKNPMCLKDIQNKMNAGEYSTATQFEKDVRQIFLNCYEYWTQDDPVFKLCEQLEKTFNERYALKDKWRAQMLKAEVIDD
ncbi:hypothetical protein BP6252_13607 [Coleophoma cylindrospora]|uniref:Bromodomain-containing protein n=1 Tax=Coleophoma cylindrospora TaxID=1849047 RepID=A0A3D8Q8P8_9HELO|nr:hypothetical protein BP6252_13607 [Coleophoma cylindrospora]